MPTYRKFYFENAAGERFGLQGERGVYLTAPEGLGYELEPVFGDLGHGFFATLDDRAEPQGVVAGTLIFTPPAYAGFRALADWIAAAGSLLLIYCPFGAEEYQRPVAVQYLNKGELTKTRLLEVPVALFKLSPWRRPVPTEIAMDSGEDRPRARYPGRYPGRYGGDSAGAMSATITAAGHLPGAVLLRYHGAISSPEIRLTGAVSGTVYGICRLTGASLQATDTLELSTLPGDSHVRKIDASGAVTDLLSFVDLSQEPFFSLPTDEAATLTVESDSVFSGSAELLAYYFFRTV